MRTLTTTAFSTIAAAMAGTAFIGIPLMTSAARGQVSTTTAPVSVAEVAPASSLGTCPVLSRYLSARVPGNRDSTTGGEVTKLQRFLADQGFFSQEPTGYFGPMTQAAVQRFQAARGLVSSGTPDTTGYGAVGPKTRTSIAQSGCASAAGQPGVSSASSPKPLPGIRVLAPNGGERYVPGEPVTIRWSGGSQTVKIKAVSRCEDAAAGECPSVERAIGSGAVSNTGEYFWKVSTDLPPGPYAIELTEGSSIASSSDSSDKPFFIESATATRPFISLMSPRNGDVWRVGQSRLVQWSLSGPISGSMVEVEMVGTSGSRFGRSRAFSGNSALIVVPPTVCKDTCPSSIPTESGNPYTLTAVLYGPADASGSRKELSRTSPVQVVVGAADASYSAELSLVATESHRNLGAAVVEYSARYYTSAAIKPLSVTLEVTCPASVSARVRYESAQICGTKAFNMASSSGIFSGFLELSNTGSAIQNVTAVAKAYGAEGQLLATASTVFTLRPTGPIPSAAIQVGQPSVGSSFSDPSTRIRVGWNPYEGVPESYRVDVGNDTPGASFLTTLVPYVLSTESGVDVLVRDVIDQANRQGIGYIPRDGYYFRVVGVRGNSYIASGTSGRFSIVPLPTSP